MISVRDAKKKHDEKVKNFKRTCAKTGGGQAPQPPPEIDGDEYDNHRNITIDSYWCKQAITSQFWKK